MLQRSITATAMARVGTSAGNLDLHLTSHHVSVSFGFYAIADAAKLVRGNHLHEAVRVQDECNGFYEVTTTSYE
jgi:hypothetical protein